MHACPVVVTPGPHQTVVIAGGLAGEARAHAHNLPVQNLPESIKAYCREMTALIRVVYSREVQQDLPGVQVVCGTVCGVRTIWGVG